MKELIVSRNKAQLEVDRYNDLIRKFTLNEYYDLDYRFEVWKREVVKYDLGKVQFNSLETAFHNQIPDCILDYEESIGRHGERSYDYLLDYVQEKQNWPSGLEFKKTEEWKLVVDWIIKENLGTFYV